jgi:hypothetical protein
VFILVARVSFSVWDSENVQNREKKDPDDVHKMPIETGAFEETMVLRGDLASKRFEKSRDQQQDADKNVQAVETS